MDQTDVCIDLHTHSMASDGSETPASLAAHAALLGLGAIALTDHDTVSGLSEFMEAGKRAGIETIPGVELSSQMYNKEVHLVGLFIDPENQSFRETLATLREGRERRNVQVVDKLRSSGYEITYDEVLKEAHGESVGRPHIAAVLVRKGYCRDTREVFQRLLRRGTPCYVQRIYLPPTQAIQAIHDAGGLAIWAHPLNALHIGRSYLRKFYRTMMPAGLDGLESYYSTYSDEQHKIVESFAEEYSLLKSGGSDYHGKNQPGVELGTGFGALKIPYSLLEAMKRKRK